jgi:hypothetical protein
VRLQIEHDLQPMFDFAQETVVVFENRLFLMRQATGRRQPLDRDERVACTDFRNGAGPPD